MKKKIFICGISTECCSYSTLIQNKKDFEVLSGKKLLKYMVMTMKLKMELALEIISM